VCVVILRLIVRWWMYSLENQFSLTKKRKKNLNDKNAKRKLATRARARICFYFSSVRSRRSGSSRRCDIYGDAEIAPKPIGIMYKVTSPFTAIHPYNWAVPFPRVTASTSHVECCRGPRGRIANSSWKTSDNRRKPASAPRRRSKENPRQLLPRNRMCAARSGRTTNASR